MAHTNPTIELLDTQKVLLSAAPTLPDGTPDPDAFLNWQSSSPSQVGIEIPTDVPGTEPPIPNTNQHVAWITTPLENGSAIVSVTVSGPNAYEEVLQPVTYAKAAAGAINVSAGVPISDE